LAHFRPVIRGLTSRIQLRPDRRAPLDPDTDTDPDPDVRLTRAERALCEPT